DPFHFVEDGTTATQNMTLAAQSLGLSTSWIGVFSLRNEKNSTERKIIKILKIPKNWRLISILPVGIPKFRQSKKRKDLSEIVDLNMFEAREEKEKLVKTEKPSVAAERMHVPRSAREIEPALV
ncbi:MAG: nitroreductase family protein, partial [Candidatus Bathyarchaeia archaeon]